MLPPHERELKQQTLCWMKPAVIPMKLGRKRYVAASHHAGKVKAIVVERLQVPGIDPINDWNSEKRD